MTTIRSADARNSITDDAELTIMSSAECYELLASRTVGRIGIFVENYPLILPVNYAMDRDVVVIRTTPDSVIAKAHQANVTFQVDEFSPTTRSGWSVLVRGQAEAVTEEHSAELIERTHATRVGPWAPGERRYWMRIIPHGINGRRITPGEILAWRLGSAAYM